MLRMLKMKCYFTNVLAPRAAISMSCGEKLGN